MTRPDKGIRANQVVVLIIWVATSCFNITARSLSMMLVTVFLLTACQTTIGRPSPEPHLERDENHDDVITITFACNGCRPDLGQGVLFGELVDRFEAENPDVNIELVALSDIVDAGWPGENPEILTHQLLSAVDTAGWPPTLPATDANLIMNLAPFINADASFNRDDFYPSMLEHLQWRNGTWALPMLGDLYVILYNRDLFDTSGVPYPQDNWTWTDFLNLTQRLTVQEGAIVEQYGFINPGPGRGHEVFIAGLSGGRSHALDTPRGAYLLDPVVVDALRHYTDLAQYHGVRLSEKEALESQWLFDLIVDGKVAMWLGRVSDLGLMKFSKLRDTSIGLAPLPLGDETAAYVFSDAYVMSSGTRHPEESWRWLRFLTSQTIQGPRYVDMIPVRRSVAEETGYWSRWDEKTRSAITYALEHAQVIKGWMRSDVYNGIVGEILHGKPVEDALMDAQVAVAQAEAIRAVATPLPPPMVAEYSPEVREGTEITFAPLGLNPTVYQRQAENFNAAQSDVYVEVVSPSERETADCFVSLGYSEEPAQLNLDPIIQRDVSFSAMDIEPVFFSAFQHQGNPFGLPIGADYVQVIVYNRDLFDAAGVAYPQPGWAWDDFIHTATALTEHNDGITRYGYMALAGHRADVHAFLALHGAALWGDQGLPRFDAPDVVAAVQYYRDLALVDGVMPTFPDELLHPEKTDQALRQRWVDEGRIAMWTDTYVAHQEESSTPNMNLGVVPLPIDERAIAQYLTIGLSISKATPHAEACWTWMKFLSEEPSTAVSIPAQRSRLASPDFAAQVGEEKAATFRAIARYIPLMPTPQSAEAHDRAQWFFEALGGILEGAPIEQTLTEVQHKALQGP